MFDAINDAQQKMTRSVYTRGKNDWYHVTQYPTQGSNLGVCKNDHSEANNEMSVMTMMNDDNERGEFITNNESWSKLRSFRANHDDDDGPMTTHVKTHSLSTQLPYIHKFKAYILSPEKKLAEQKAKTWTKAKRSITKLSPQRFQLNNHINFLSRRNFTFFPISRDSYANGSSKYGTIFNSVFLCLTTPSFVPHFDMMR